MKKKLLTRMAAVFFGYSLFTMFCHAASGGGLYMVIDLSGGTTASSYPISYLDIVPTGGWTDEYKTNKLVMRKIEPGTFMMGSPVGEIGRNGDADVQHKVTITKPYYIGVFEVTQRQWELVMGVNPSCFTGVKRPVETVSYDVIRGVKLGAEWPKSQGVDEESFLANIRKRTKLEDLDLPTEAQWEYACRAGTTTAWNSGKDIVNGDIDVELGKVGWYGGNATETQDVGMLAPNAWGLYDMHGNVFEWCLDYYDWYSAAAVTDPVGPTVPNKGTNYDRIIKGGSYERLAHGCRSGSHGGYASYRVSHVGGDFGLRLAMTCKETVVDPVVTKCAVTFDAGGGTAEWTKCEVAKGEAIGTLPTATRNGYVFDGWYTLPSGGDRVMSSTTVTGDIALYAHWLQAAAMLIRMNSFRQRYPWNGLVDVDCEVSIGADSGYKVGLEVVDDEAGTNLAVKTLWVVGGEETNKYVSVRSGAQRLVWNADADLPDGFKCKMGRARLRLAKQVAFDAAGGQCDERAKAFVLGEPYGALPIPTRSGYQFVGWCAAAYDGARIDSESIADPVISVLTAKWEVR